MRKSRIGLIGIFFLLLLYNFSDTLAQNDNSNVDSTRLIINDTASILNQIDTITNTPLYTHGSRFMLPYNNVEVIKKDDIQLINYFQPSDILKTKLNAYPLSLGSYGHFNHISAYGAMAQDVGVYYNNRPLNDLEFGSYNLEQLQPEFFEKLEILEGSDAVVFGDNSSGYLINNQEIRYNSMKPYTRIWYCQSGIQGIASDALFSQNIIKNTNFTIGYRSINDPGTYPNSSLDAWNIRGIFRWNPTNLSSISLVENYSNFYLGTNGGVNKDASTNIFDPLFSEVNYQKLAERNIRHDITLTYSSYLNDIKLSAISAVLYYSNSFWRKDRNSALIFIPSDSSINFETSSGNLGTVVSFEQSISDFFVFRTGASLYYYNIEGSNYQTQSYGIGFSAYFHSNLQLSKMLNLSGGIRIAEKYGFMLYSFGGRTTVDLSNGLKLFADFSISEKPPSPVDGFILKKEKDILTIIGTKFRNRTFSFNVDLFGRFILDPLISEKITDSANIILTTSTYNGTNATVAGCYINLSTELFKNFHIDCFTQLHYSILNEEISDWYPLVYAGISPYYEIFRSRSYLRIGFRFNILSNFKGLQFIPQTRRYISSDFETSIYNNGIDFFLAAKLGRANIRIDFENILAQGFFYTPIYPQLQRILKISVSWPFMD